MIEEEGTDFELKRSLLAACANMPLEIMDLKRSIDACGGRVVWVGTGRITGRPKDRIYHIQFHAGKDFSPGDARFMAEHFGWFVFDWTPTHPGTTKVMTVGYKKEDFPPVTDWLTLFGLPARTGGRVGL